MIELIFRVSKSTVLYILSDTQKRAGMSADFFKTKPT